jgi:hypothetical protein
MTTKNFLQTAGWGSILAGVIWIALAILVISGREVFASAALDYLGVLAAALVLVAALALYLQGSHNTVGAALLALGSASLTFSILLYAIAFDPQDGAAFTLFFFGTIIQGLGLAVLGFRFRSHGESKGWSTTLLLLGFLLILAFPAWFFFENSTSLSITDQYGDYFWGTIMVLQAISWIILGRSASVGSPRVDEQSVELAG